MTPISQLNENYRMTFRPIRLHFDRKNREHFITGIGAVYS